MLTTQLNFHFVQFPFSIYFSVRFVGPVPEWKLATSQTRRWFVLVVCFEANSTRFPGAKSMWKWNFWCEKPEVVHVYPPTHTASINDSFGVNSCRAYIIHESREIKPRKFSWIESFTIRCVLKMFISSRSKLPFRRKGMSTRKESQMKRHEGRQRENVKSYFSLQALIVKRGKEMRVKSFARAWKLSQRLCLSDERSQSRKLGDRSVHSAIAVTSLDRSVKVEKICFSSLFFGAVSTIDFFVTRKSL